MVNRRRRALQFYNNILKVDIVLVAVGEVDGNGIGAFWQTIVVVICRHLSGYLFPLSRGIHDAYSLPIEIVSWLCFRVCGELSCDICFHLKRDRKDVTKP